MSDNLNTIAKGKRVAIWASVVTAFIAVIKYGIGVAYNSDVLIADGIHSLADTAAIAASAFGLYLAGRAKTERFPYGLYRAETLALLFVGIFIFFAGIDMVREGILKIQSPSRTESIPVIPALTAVLSIIVAIGIAWSELRVSRQMHSRSLEANAKESFYDVISSTVVLSGIILPAYTVPHVEGIVIVLISLLILKIGVESTVRSILVLLDANIDEELREEIEDIVSAIGGIKEVDGINIREAGPIKIVELTIMISPSATVFAATNISEEVERKIHETFAYVETVIVHIRPVSREVYRVVIPVGSIEGLDSKVFPQFGRAPYYAIVKIVGDECTIEDFYLNEFLEKDKHVGLNIVKSLMHFNIDLIFADQIGEISFYIIKDNLVDIYQIPVEMMTIRDVSALFLRGKLARIDKPTHVSGSGIPGE